MLQRVIQEKQKELKVLGGTLKQPGAVSQMKSLVSELMQYSVTPGELEEWSGPGGSSGAEAEGCQQGL